MDSQCKEAFLEDVVRIDVYNSSEVSFTLPVNLPGINSMAAPSLPAAKLSLVYGESEAAYAVRDGSIKVKQTQKQAGSGLIYIYNVEAVVETGISDVVERVRGMLNADHHIVATKADGMRYLLYALPNTFSADQSNDSSELSLKMAVSSVSGFVVLT